MAVGYYHDHNGTIVSPVEVVGGSRWFEAFYALSDRTQVSVENIPWLTTIAYEF